MEVLGAAKGLEGRGSLSQCPLKGLHLSSGARDLTLPTPRSPAGLGCSVTHLTGGKTEAQQGEGSCPSHGANPWLSWDELELSSLGFWDEANIVTTCFGFPFIIF